MKRPALTDSPAFHALEAHYTHTQAPTLRSLFDTDRERGDRYSVEAAGLFLDYSKNCVTDEILRLLLNLAAERGVEDWRAAMFRGDKINLSEHRAVLHTALRAPRDSVLMMDGVNVGYEIHQVLDRMRAFTDRVRSGHWTGFDGDAITDIVNIGIGGSGLGPKMACRALREFAHPRLQSHFVANVDGHDLAAVLAQVQPATTLFIICSKTFATTETMMNAQSARSWFLQSGSASDLHRHFVAVSTNTEAVTAFGIDVDNMFPFWDWVGGRYSVWSAIGLSLALSTGFDHFQAFLAGAHAMDQHFQTAPLARNMPVLLAMTGFLNRQFFRAGSVSIAPYHRDLAAFPSYLQQLDMESNGKQVAADGARMTVPTGPIIWGNVGTDAQHAYFQWLHQGTDPTPIDFIAALTPGHALPGHHAALLANCFAQSEAFMRGKTSDEVRADLQAQGMEPDAIEALVPHRTFPGSRPSNTILMDALTPASLGALIALYEHKVFVQGIVWGINSFDQWGVELGKVMAKSIQEELNGSAQPARHDSSTNALIARASRALRRQAP
ncbi:MAG: glucose-6-phosphate isomerase [Herminiimonas sp.]|nr:glucose-6-phosphate isomerase [Herminiimonas sp.]